MADSLATFFMPASTILAVAYTRALAASISVAMFASMTYLKPARGMLEAVARKIGETKRTSVFEVKVFEKGELVAIFQGTGYKLEDRGK